MLFVCFYSVPNLIVILLNLLYLYLLWDLIVMGYVLERVCVKTQAIEAKRVLVGISQSEACALHMTAMRRVSTGWRQLCLASISQVRPSHETPARHFVSPVCIMKYTLSVPTLYIFILPINDEESF